MKTLLTFLVLISSSLAFTSNSIHEQDKKDTMAKRSALKEYLYYEMNIINSQILSMRIEKTYTKPDSILIAIMTLLQGYTQDQMLTSDRYFHLNLYSVKYVSRNHNNCSIKLSLSLHPKYEVNLYEKPICNDVFK